MTTKIGPSIAAVRTPVVAPDPPAPAESQASVAQTSADSFQPGPSSTSPTADPSRTLTPEEKMMQLALKMKQVISNIR